MGVANTPGARTAPKAPARVWQPPPLARAVRTYAHLKGGFDVACPACHTLNLVGALVGHRRRRAGTKKRAGYDDLTGVLTCRGCHKAWYVGLVLWGLGQGPRGRPADHVLTPEEAEGLRAAHGAYGKSEDADRKKARATVNLVCWCGLECPAHPRSDNDLIE